MPGHKTFAPTQETAGYVIDRFRLGSGTGYLTPVARGAMGRIWRLSLPDRDYAVKELFWAVDEAAVEREATFSAAAARAGVVSPANVRTDDGRYVCRLPAELGGAEVRVFSWVDGRPVDRDDHGLSEWIGHTLGVLHSLRHPCSDVAPDPWYDRVPEPARWDDLLADAEATRRPWAAALAQALPQLRSLASQVVPANPTALIYSHLDLQPQNVILDPSGTFVLLDWEDAGPGMPDRGLAGVLCSWAVHDGVIDVPRTQRILQAYRQAGGYASLTDMQSFSASLAGHLNYVEAQAALSLDTSQATEMREHADLELASCLPDPPRPDLFRQLVRVVGAR